MVGHTVFRESHHILINEVSRLRHGKRQSRNTADYSVRLILELRGGLQVEQHDRMSTQSYNGVIVRLTFKEDQLNDGDDRLIRAWR